MMDFLQIISGKKSHKFSTPPRVVTYFLPTTVDSLPPAPQIYLLLADGTPDVQLHPLASLPDDKSHLLAVSSRRGSAHLTVRGAATPRHCVRERLSAWPSEMVCFITLVLEIYHFLYLPPYAR